MRFYMILYAYTIVWFYDVAWSITSSRRLQLVGDKVAEYGSVAAAACAQKEAAQVESIFMYSLEQNCNKFQEIDHWWLLMTFERVIF